MFINIIVLTSMTLKLEQVNLNSAIPLSSKIGQLYEVNQLTSLCGIENCKQYIDQLSNTFIYTRKLYSDGNTFYRAFMFSMLEHFIITENINEFDKLLKSFNDILSPHNVFKNHDEKIDKEQIIHIIYLLKSFLERNEVIGAHHLLLKVYIEYPNFDLVYLSKKP